MPWFRPFQAGPGLDNLPRVEARACSPASLAGFVIVFLACMAGEPSFSQPLESSLAIPCNLALPGSLTNALVCSDNATAAQQLFKLDCIGTHTPEVTEE